MSSERKALVDDLRGSSEDSRQLLPLNHRLRQTYRVIVGLVGLFLVVAAAYGFAIAGDVPFAGDQGVSLLGYTINRAAAVMWIGVGVVSVFSALVDRNALPGIATGLGLALLIFGIVLLATLWGSWNGLAYTVTDVLVTFVVGLVLLWCGMYSWGLAERRRNEMRQRGTFARDVRDSDYRRDRTLRRLADSGRGYRGGIAVGRGTRGRHEAA